MYSWDIYNFINYINQTQISQMHTFMIFKNKSLHLLCLENLNLKCEVHRYIETVNKFSKIHVTMVPRAKFTCY